MNVEIFSSECRVCCWSSLLADFGKNIFLRHHLTGSSRVNDVISKKAVERGALVIGNILQKLLDQCNQFWLYGGRLRELRMSNVETGNPIAARSHSQNENDPAQRDRSSCNALSYAHSVSIGDAACCVSTDLCVSNLLNEK